MPSIDVNPDPEFACELKVHQSKFNRMPVVMALTSHIDLSLNES